MLDNGIDGLDAIKESCPDIVITDIKMPQMDGLTMIKNIIREGIESKIVILSSYSEFHMVKEAFKLGISDYILKSEIDEETLTRVLVKLINSISFQRKNWMRRKIYSIKETESKRLFWASKKYPIAVST